MNRLFVMPLLLIDYIKVKYFSQSWLNPFFLKSWLHPYNVYTIKHGKIHIIGFYPIKGEMYCSILRVLVYCQSKALRLE